MPKFIPPTIEMVRAYIIEKGWLAVQAQEFIDVNEAGNWEDKYGKPYKYWKRVLATWFHNARRYGYKPNICRLCRGYGEYTSTDDTGQQYWLCEAHKPKAKRSLPDELTDVCEAPEKDLNMGKRRTMLIRQIRKI